MCASPLCPFSSSTRNMALGSGSETVPSTSMASFLGKLPVDLSHGHARHVRRRAEPTPGWRWTDSIGAARAERPGSEWTHEKSPRKRFVASPKDARERGSLFTSGRAAQEALGGAHHGGAQGRAQGDGGPVPEGVQEGDR